MGNRMTYDSRQCFSMAKKLLGMGWLCTHWRKSEREVYRWTADPNHCGQWRENPLEKLLEQNRELDRRGFEAEAAAAVHVLAEDLGLRVVNPAPLPGDADPAEVLPQAREVADQLFAALRRGLASESEVSALLSRTVRGLEAAAGCYRRREAPAEMYFDAGATVSPFAGRTRRPWWQFWRKGA